MARPVLVGGSSQLEWRYGYASRWSCRIWFGCEGFTAGGAGLVRGPSGRRDSDDDDQDSGSDRPDYLTEDEETWAAGRRGAVPPVIE
ncbi:hypothetical protein NKH18_37310 [Streptomyces sp. M10(2022)]